ncbi:SusC/RagA family TonB-linked outer membrane protein [Pararhodonellum marinum]|uniref:SusC/RagA family TonB-linked outer membrane protein n=1 Tax=Pararhodonellum marinum TaxID=2755358 RepID=UPI001890A304|nr:TonB-dependent receptor [Pararhodonellum marinum]
MKEFYKKLSVLLVLLLFSSAMVLAQRTVTGQITDEFGEGLPGVTVLLKGTTTGTATDIEGNYSLNVPSNESILVFSFVGYLNKEEVVGNRTIVSVAMNPDVQTLSEMVVTGYAVQERKDITGAVATVKSEDLMAVPSATVENQLQGRLAGVNVVSSGQPGQGSQVRIRGFGSFSNNAPLYVVDGVQTFDISTLNPNDVENITVLKDAGAASIYGSRAANGVILVTTKKGQKGAVRIDYNGFYGVQDPGRGFTNLLDTQGMADLQWLVFANGPSDTENHAQYGTWTRGGPGPRIPDYIVPAGAMEGDPRVNPDNYFLDLNNLGATNQIVRANQVGTNWFDEVTRQAPIQNHDFTFAGGGENSRFLAGLNYFEQQGIILETFSKRYSVRLNSEFDVGKAKRVRVGENLQVSYRQNRGITGGNQSEGNAISMVYRIQPIIPVRDIMGNYAGTRAETTGNGQNPVANQERTRDNDAFDTRILGNVYLEADLTPDLTFRTSMGGSLQNGYFYNFNYQTYERSENVATNSLNEGGFFNSDWIWTNTLTYQKQFDKHRITAVGGYESLKFDMGRNNLGIRGNYFSLDPNFWTLANGASIIQATSGANTPTTLVSQFLRADYGYDDRYFLSATVRRDGSSRFRDQFGVFPSVTAGWRLSGENFLAGSSFITDLKLRGGYGTMGNQQALSPQNQFFLFAGAQNASFYDIAGTNTSSAQGFRPTRIGNPDARWERSVNTNIGLDGAFWDGKFEFFLDWYNRENVDLLFDPPLPGTAGAAAVPFVNIARMRNTGVDAQVIYRTQFARDWRFEGNLTFTTFNNEILEIAEGQNEFFRGGGSRFGTLTINRIGESVGSFFGYQVQGLFQSQEEINGAATQEDAAPGRFRYVDANGDGDISPADRVILGSPIPDFTAGLNLSFGYKNWDFSTFLFASVGNDIYNYTKWWTDFWPSFQGGKSIDALNNSWLPSRPNATTPIAENVSNFSTNTQSTSYYIEDGSYLRARQMQLGYTLTPQAVEKLGLSRLRVYVQAVNLFTITGYSGLDPELQGVGDNSTFDLSLGIDYGNYPPVKQFIFGVNIGF